MSKNLFNTAVSLQFFFNLINESIMFSKLKSKCKCIGNITVFVNSRLTLVKIFLVFSF